MHGDVIPVEARRLPFFAKATKGNFRSSSYGGHQPSSTLRLASRSLGEGWWRRRELNPRPKWPSMTRLRACPIRNLSPALRTGKKERNPA